MRPLHWCLCLLLLSGCQFPRTPPTPDLVVKHILPDHKKTPGVVRAGIPLSELCRPGHARQVRQELTDSQWIRRKREVYTRYGIKHHERGEYEVDHLISIELNGSNSIENLFPQTQRAVWSAAVKDRLENRLHALVCQRQISLQQADAAIANDWIAAYKRYVGSTPQSTTPEAD